MSNHHKSKIASDSTERAGASELGDSMKTGSTYQIASAGKKHKLVCSTLFVLLIVLSSRVEGQQTRKVPLVGYLAGSSVSIGKLNVDALRRGFRDLGYIEEKNLLIEYRWAEAKFDRLPALAAELVSLNPEVIVTAGTRPTVAVKQATSTIPIVVASAGDLVGTGLVASLARPGGNVTGSTNIDPDLSAKRQLLKETFPKLSRVAMLYYGGPGEMKTNRERRKLRPRDGEFRFNRTVCKNLGSLK